MVSLGPYGEALRSCRAVLREAQSGLRARLSALREGGQAAFVAALLIAAAAGWPDARPPPADEAILPPPRGAERLLYGLALDANLEPEAALEALPSVGPARARALVRAREARPFVRCADLLSVPGIGPVTYARIAPHVEVRGVVCRSAREARPGSPSEPFEG